MSGVMQRTGDQRDKRRAAKRAQRTPKKVFLYVDSGVTAPGTR